MTISDELYNKYKNKQGKCYSEICNLGSRHEKYIKLLEQTKDNTERKTLENRINILKERIEIYQVKSSVLREFLHEIAMENKEDKANDT
jgi:predicted  nucleic acid-binding Zn-ribbon protein